MTSTPSDRLFYHTPADLIFRLDFLTLGAAVAILPKRLGAILGLVLLLGPAASPSRQSQALRPPSHDLVFSALPSRWDEALPMGNGAVGALVWQNDGKLRLSLDRADLWDLRPMDNLNSPEWKFQWVVEQWKKGDYKPVQEKFDRPYDDNPAPTKIPAGALEIDLAGFPLLVNLTGSALPAHLPRAFPGKVVRHPVVDPFGSTLPVYREAREAIRRFITGDLPLHLQNL
jgi:hypothetical protein